MRERVKEWICGCCAACGQHEARLVLRSPASQVRDALWQDVVSKNSAEPQAAPRNTAKGG